MARAEYKVGQLVATTKTRNAATVVKVWELNTRCAYKVRAEDGTELIVKDTDMLGFVISEIDLSEEGQAKLWAQFEEMCS